VTIGPPPALPPQESQLDSMGHRAHPGVALGPSPSSVGVVWRDGADEAAPGLTSDVAETERGQQSPTGMISDPPMMKLE
jgi:hypothetical protein